MEARPSRCRRGLPFMFQVAEGGSRVIASAVRHVRACCLKTRRRGREGFVIGGSTGWPVAVVRGRCGERVLLRREGGPGLRFTRPPRDREVRPRGGREARAPTSLRARAPEDRRSQRSRRGKTISEAAEKQGAETFVAQLCLQRRDPQRGEHPDGSTGVDHTLSLSLGDVFGSVSIEEREDEHIGRLEQHPPEVPAGRFRGRKMTAPPSHGMAGSPPGTPIFRRLNESQKGAAIQEQFGRRERMARPAGGRSPAKGEAETRA